MHDYEAKCLHLVYPGLVFFVEFGIGRPLILTPEQSSLIRVLHWTVKVNCFVVIGLFHRYILPQPLVSYQKGVRKQI